MTSQITDFVNFNDYDDMFSSALNNGYVNLGVSLFLVLYAAIIAPKMSPEQKFPRLINHWLVKLLLFFLIVYVSSRNVTLGIVLLIAVMATLIVSEKKTTYIYVDQGSDKLSQHQYQPNQHHSDQHQQQQIIETKDDEQVMLDNNVENGSEDHVSGIVDEILVNNIGEDSNSGNFHPVDQGAMTSLGRSIRMLLPLNNNTSSDSDSDSDSDSGSNISESMPLKQSVEQVSAEIEQEHGEKVPEITKETVLEQLKQKIGNMTLRGSNIMNGNELLEMCRDVFQSLTLQQ
jgi:hypothetical protein